MIIRTEIPDEDILIDFHQDICFGEEPVSDGKLTLVATVRFPLLDMDSLVQSADMLRQSMGFRPMWPTEQCSYEMCDTSGWYDFYLSVSEDSPGMTEDRLCFTVQNSTSSDNEMWYAIELTEEERRNFYGLLNSQCVRYGGKTCEDLLHESERIMRESWDRVKPA